MHARLAFGGVGMMIGSVDMAFDSVDMYHVVQNCRPTVSNHGLQRRRGNCFKPPTMPNPPTNPPYTSRPFLRKQESHFTTATTPRNLGGDAAHSYEIPAFAGMVYLGTEDCGRILATVRATIWRRRALPFEIPAFAGMSCICPTIWHYRQN